MYMYIYIYIYIYMKIYIYIYIYTHTHTHTGLCHALVAPGRAPDGVHLLVHLQLLPPHLARGQAHRGQHPIAGVRASDRVAGGRGEPARPRPRRPGDHGPVTSDQ